MALLSLEVSLAWLISKSEHTQADRRLNEIENQLSALAQLHRTIDVPGEVRLTPATVEQLVGWVTEHEVAFGELITRLEQYTSDVVLVGNTQSRDGWISLYLA
ncbi:hypothetical protein BH09GEM1_BH09GEM1_24700 [soil metagenome]